MSRASRVPARGHAPAPGRRRLALAAALLAAVVAPWLLGACGREAVGPEAEIRALIDAGEQAAEARDLDAVMALVSGEYADAEGRSRRDLALYVRGLFALHPSLELLVRVESIELDGPEHARATLDVASVGRRRAEGVSLAASDRTVTLNLRRDGGEWRVISARWSDRAI